MFDSDQVGKLVPNNGSVWVNTIIERNLTAIETEIEMGAQHVVHDYSKRCCQEHAIFAYELHSRPFYSITIVPELVLLIRFTVRNTHCISMLLLSILSDQS